MNGPVQRRLSCICVYIGAHTHIYICSLPYNSKVYRIRTLKEHNERGTVFSTLMRDDVHGVADAAVDHEACTGVAAPVRLPRVRHEEPEIQNFEADEFIR